MATKGNGAAGLSRDRRDAAENRVDSTTAHALDPRVLALAQAFADLLVLRPAGGDELVPLDAAARIAATSVRVVRGAIRSGDLPAFGKQRDRAVKREDLSKWIETRRMPVERGADDADIARRVARLRLVASRKERGR